MVRQLNMIFVVESWPYKNGERITLSNEEFQVLVDAFKA